MVGERESVERERERESGVGEWREGVEWESEEGEWSGRGRVEWGVERESGVERGSGGGAGVAGQDWPAAERAPLRIVQCCAVQSSVVLCSLMWCRVV